MWACCETGCAHKADEFTSFDMLPEDGDCLAHVRVNRIELLVVISKILTDPNRDAKWVSLVAGRLSKESPTYPDHCAGTCGHNGGAFRSGNVNSGVYNVCK